MKYQKDLTSEIFGKLTVISKTNQKNNSGYIWKCKCDCGQEVLVARQHLIRNKVRSCGCIRNKPKKDLTGSKFYKLTVVSWTGITTPNSGAIWFRKCDYGNSTNVRGSSLTSGNTMGCGCANLTYEGNLGGLYNAFAQYKTNAKKRNLTFDLSFEEFRSLLDSPCYYCGLNPSHKWPSVSRLNPSFYTGSGVDRRISSVGYYIDNCVSCCTQCNIAKKNYSEDEFISWVHRVSKYLGQK